MKRLFCLVVLGLAVAIDCAAAGESNTRSDDSAAASSGHAATPQSESASNTHWSHWQERPRGLVGHIQSVAGNPFGIDVQGDIVYLGDWGEGPGGGDLGNLQTYDVSNPGRPIRLGSISTSEQIQDVAVKGSRAFVANDALGITAFDVSNPRRLRFLGGRSDGSFANSIALAKLGAECSLYAFVGYFYSGQLQIYDLRDPARIPAPVSYQSPDYVDHVIDSEVVRDRAFIVVDSPGVNTIEVLDLSGFPASPTRIGKLPLPVRAFGNWGKLRTSGRYLYYAQSKWLDENVSGGLRVIDVGDPRNPRLVGTLNIADIGHIPWKGTGLDIVTHGWKTYAFMVGKTALHVIDVSNPSVPREIVTYPLPRAFDYVEGGNVVVEKGIAYVAVYSDTTRGPGGLAIYKIANPSFGRREHYRCTWAGR